ncbi:MAG: ergothioneine biosynthesis protein EgtB, partial [Flavipsychrobacter sp.]
MNLAQQYNTVRQRTEQICKPPKTEDYVVQPVVDVSPPKWHLGHTTWFFETFILKPNLQNYNEFDPNYNFVFNSYYETIGARVIRTDRGNLSRPGVEDIYKYRQHVDDAMQELLTKEIDSELEATIVLGLNHEEQHQELLWTDIKYILGHNPLFPAYDESAKQQTSSGSNTDRLLEIEQGIYDIGYNGNAFCFDNELSRHKVYLEDFSIAQELVTNCEYLEFMNAGGYTNFKYWHAEGWDWVKNNNIQSPLYWHFIDGQWYYYTLAGLKLVDIATAVCHISFYEASAYSAWKGMRLPTEFEWEAASEHFAWGKRWEWTNSAYLPYPGFKKAEGAIG